MAGASSSNSTKVSPLGSVRDTHLLDESSLNGVKIVISKEYHRPGMCPKVIDICQDIDVDRPIRLSVSFMLRDGMPPRARLS